MRSRSSFRPLRLEVLDSREAPAQLTISPPAAEGHGPGEITATVSDNACAEGHGIDRASANGVVSCGD